MIMEYLVVLEVEEVLKANKQGNKIKGYHHAKRAHEPNWKTKLIEVLLLKLNNINDKNKMKNSPKNIAIIHDSMLI